MRSNKLIRYENIFSERKSSADNFTNLQCRWKSRMFLSSQTISRVAESFSRVLFFPIKNEHKTSSPSCSWSNWIEIIIFWFFDLLFDWKKSLLKILSSEGERKTLAAKKALIVNRAGQLKVNYFLSYLMRGHLKLKHFGHTHIWLSNFSSFN